MCIFFLESDHWRNTLAGTSTQCQRWWSQPFNHFDFVGSLLGIYTCFSFLKICVYVTACFFLKRKGGALHHTTFLKENIHFATIIRTSQTIQQPTNELSPRPVVTAGSMENPNRSAAGNLSPLLAAGLWLCLPSLLVKVIFEFLPWDSSPVNNHLGEYVWNLCQAF